MKLKEKCISEGQLITELLKIPIDLHELVYSDCVIILLY